MSRAACACACLALLLSTSAQAEMTDAKLYLLHCSGCHGAAGHGAPAAGIPDLALSGAYVTVPKGRDYLAQVPGISQSRLDDATAARLLNYVLRHYAADSLPATFTPYTAAELNRLRADKASDAETRRAAVLSDLAALAAARRR